MYLWHVARSSDGRVELVNRWESLDAVIAEMAESFWNVKEFAEGAEISLSLAYLRIAEGRVPHRRIAQAR